ncbi:MAG: TrmH family RNA methyltransferase [Glaciecola sp.]|jgi:TrmH family RNA methyltransferase
MDPALVRLEGLHALKHALRFAAHVEQALTSDRDAVLRLAAEVCPDLLEVLAELLVEVTPELLVDDRGRALPSPVVALARRPAWTLFDLASRMDRPVVLLERPTHLGNLGACIRVAAAADAAGLLSTGSADPWHPGAVRGAAGLQFALPVLGPLEGIPALDGRPLIAVDPEGDVNADVPANAILAFGSEREGLTEATKERADAILALPMRSGVSSLNLATSVAATLYRGR